jgi:starvation-inducible DNA-binding protein
VAGTATAVGGGGAGALVAEGTEVPPDSRALGVPAPGSYSAYAKLSTINEADGVPSATDMVRILADDQLAVVRTARSVFPLADAANDEPTADLLTQRLEVHEKTAWMLRSLLEN